MNKKQGEKQRKTYQYLTMKILFRGRDSHETKRQQTCKELVNLINGEVGIKMSCVKNFLKFNNRGALIGDSRVIAWLTYPYIIWEALVWSSTTPIWWCKRKVKWLRHTIFSWKNSFNIPEKRSSGSREYPIKSRNVW